MRLSKSDTMRGLQKVRWRSTSGVTSKGPKEHHRCTVSASGDGVAVSQSQPEKEAKAKDSRSLLVQSLPQGDKLDGLIAKLWIPAVCNFMLIPLVGAADVFWVGRMGDAACLAAQGAADRVFSSAFWTISFLPSLVTPLVAKAAAAGDKEALHNQIGEAIFVAIIVGCIGMVTISQLPHMVLKVVGVLPGTGMYNLAEPYLLIRSMTFIPAIVATVGFSAFRGTMDVMTPLKITFFTQALNVICDPIFIFGLGPIKAMGVTGAALATAMSEIAGCASYSVLMVKKGLARWGTLIRLPSWGSLAPLLVGGAAVQLRSLALNLGLLAVTRATLAMDPSGTMAAAHTITVNLWQLAGVVLLALSTVGTILIPQTLSKAEEEGGLLAAKKVGDRLLMWGLFIGIVLGGLQFLAIPLLGFFTPIKAVQEAARVPAMLAAAQQGINGVAFVAEGMMQGHQAFGKLAVNTGLAALALMVAIDEGMGSSLVGVWGCFWIFNGIRLALALHHHFIGGPLAPKRLRAKGLMP